MKMIQQKAEAIASASGMGAGVIDPVTIIAIIGLVLDLIKMWQDCHKTPTQALESAKSPGIVGNVLFHRMVNKHLRHHRKKAMIADKAKLIGRELTIADMAAMYAEVTPGASDA